MGETQRDGRDIAATASGAFEGNIRQNAERVWSGLRPCITAAFDPDAPEGLKAAFYRAACRNGVSLYSVPYVTLSHEHPDLEEALKRMERTVKEPWPLTSTSTLCQTRAIRTCCPRLFASAA